MAETYNSVLRDLTDSYLAGIDPNDPPEPYEIEEELLGLIVTAVTKHNNDPNKGDDFVRWKKPTTLDFQQIAEIVAYLYPVCRIETAGAGTDTEYDLLAIYQTDGPDEGIYVTSDETFRTLARKYNYQMDSRTFNEFMKALRDLVPKKNRCHEPNLIAVNNGIFDFNTKQLLPFTPDYVFMAKSRIDYNPNAQNVVIHNKDDNTDWDVESWMSDLSDDPEIVNVLWEILGAIIRPNVPWDKSAWFYSETGNNGKGTLCELMRQLCGDGSYASIPLSDMGKDFMLEPLTRATAIIVDENDVGTYIDKAANLKAIITSDAIAINRKFRMPIAYRFHGFMVQCLNEMPKIKDKSDSFWRRQLFVPFDKCFTGIERKYIKHDYLHRTEVLEYVLYRVLNMNYYQLSVPEACKEALEEYKDYNDPVRQFINEIVPQLTWDLVPYTFLFDLYRAWYDRNFPNGKCASSRSFKDEFRKLMKGNPNWDCSDHKRNRRVGKRMDSPEMLIQTYGLTSWMNPRYTSSLDKTKMCTPDNLNPTYTGMLRRNSSIAENEKQAS